MKLTQLEIKGFKSFGERTTIHFNDGITAIVGPNGCGKSNVVDAIRWVLGEQSTRMLRSEKMENIIFNGTKDRKPGNLAEVSLTFDNTKNLLPTEYNTVTLTRKLYRTGESEYRLNDIPCRLKDITDLFLDTGIGADSYSIIELKMIEELLNDKDNSRRNLFEEAAGIAKYKVRKKQTLNKLKDTEADLSRVDDLLFEIDKNLKTLESQAKKTERYYKLKEQYKELSTALASFKLQNFSKTLEELEKQEQIHQEERSGLNTNTDTTEATLQQQKLEHLTLEKNLSIQQKATNEFVAKIREYESNKKLKNEQLRFQQEKVGRLERELETDKASLLEINDALQSLNLQKTQESALYADLEKKISAWKESLDLLRTEQQQAKSSLDALEKQANELQNSIYKKEKEAEIIRIQHQSLSAEQARNREEAGNKQAELSSFNDALNRLEGILEVQENDLERLEAQEQQLLVDQQKTADQLQQSKDKLAQTHRSLDAKQNEYNLTKSLVENLEGFPESIRFLKKNAAWAKNAPLLSDVLFCKEEFRVAIENYLEPYMNYYVVQNNAEAIQAINLLSDAAKGRAHFFVLDAFEDYKAEDSLLNFEHNQFTPAIDIIEAEDKYKKLCAHLLKNVFLVNADEERTIADFKDEKVVLLGKSGKYGKSRFSFSGGSVGLFEGKRIGRAKNLEVLAKEIKNDEDQLFHLKGQIDDLQQKQVDLKNASKQVAINELKSTLAKTTNELTALQVRKEQYESFISNSTNKAEDIARQLDLYTAQLTQLEPELLQLNQEKESSGQSLTAQKEQFHLLSEKVNDESNRYNQENIGFHQQQNKVAGIAKELEYKQAHQTSVSKRIEEDTLELQNCNASIKELLTQSDTNDEDLLAMYEQKTDMEAALAEVEESFFKLRGSISELENSLSELRRKKENHEQLVTAIKDRKTNLRIELNALKERLSVEFNISIDDLLDVPPPADETEDSVREKTERLKNTLDNFGAINPMAVEAYTEMNERCQFILTQKNDLLSAKASLTATIDEIDETAKNQFMDAFVQIRENFIKVFRSLFNEEDSCDLYLLDPENPLESDIDIVAKPKGKRPLTINQLSGGEKTLTATALLFSLYLLKPAPFCIFDEVDAPLDDTNIDKFNNIIRKFSDESQFIIVSHNKRTIASTDVIYGVTMVEQGISRVVPVDMRQVAAA